MAELKRRQKMPVQVYVLVKKQYCERKTRPDRNK